MNHKIKFIVFFILGFVPFILSAQQINMEIVDWLKKHALSPDKYIIEKFQTHDVVLLGEHHVVKENLLFVQDMIPKLYQSGIYNLGMEFGASEFQNELDELVDAPEYDEEKAKAIMFAYNVAWGFQEYLDVYKAAWKLNRSLPEGARKFRILNLSYVFDWEKFKGERTNESMRLVFNKGTVDKYRAEIIDNEINGKNEKVLVLVGTPHAYTRYGSPYYKYNGENFCDYDFDWLGNRLYKKYPEKVFNIILHQAFTQKEKDNYFLISPSGGAIEQLMMENANIPAGFDLTGTPVGKLPDNSINSMCYENFTLEQYFDGYIFLEPLRELEGCTVIDDFVNEQNFEYALKNFPDPDWHEKITTLDDLKRFIRSNSERISIQYQGL